MTGAVVLVAPARGQHQAASAEQSFGEAVQLYQVQMYSAAGSAFDAFRQSHPSHLQAGQALYLQATSALASDRDALAVRLFERLQASYPSHPRAASVQLRLARYFLEQDQTDQARQQLMALTEDPSTDAQAARALFLLGQTDREQGNLRAALRRFERVRSQYPGTDVAPAAFYAAGATQVQLEEYDAAAAAFERLGQQFPSSPYAQNLGTALAEVYYRLDEYQDAVSELEQRLPALPSSGQARARFLLAESYNQLDRGAEALSQYRQVLEQHSDSPYVLPVRFGMGWRHVQSGRYADAVDAFSRVRQASPNDLGVQAAYLEAVSRSRMGDAEAAVERFRSLATNAPDHPLAPHSQYEAGLLLYQQENYDAAAASFRALIRANPASERAGEAYFWLGNANLARAALDEALEAYNQAVERGTAPDSLLREVRYQKAWAQYQDEQYSGAQSAFLSLADAHPNTDRGRDALFWAGDCAYQQDQIGRAGTLFRRYLESGKDLSHRAGALYALGWAYFRQNRYEAAATRFRQFLSAYDEADAAVPYAQDARLRLADAYFALKQYDTAVEVYRRVSGEGADYALFQAGDALNFANQPEEAVATLQRVVNGFPDSPWHAEALSRLASIQIQQQNYEAARETYRELLRQHSGSDLAPQAQYGIGDTFYNASDFEAAVEAYRTVLVEYPQSAIASEAAPSLFFALSAAGQANRSDNLIQEIESATPNTLLTDRLRFYRAYVAYESGASERALRLFREYVRTASGTDELPSAYYYLGLLYADQDANTEAKNYLRQLVDQYPNSERFPVGALRLGDINADQENYEAAAEVYRKAAENDRTGAELRAQARYGQGVALLQLGRTDEAETLLRDILRGDQSGPVRTSARLGLARIHESEGRTQEALTLYRSVLDAADGETGAEALYRLGSLLRNQGQPQKAVEELQRMPSLFAGYPKWNARALLEQARSYRQMRETGQAVKLYDEVTTSYAGTPYAETAREERDAL